MSARPALPHLHSREPKDMASKDVNKHNTHALQLSQEVNDRILRATNGLNSKSHTTVSKEEQQTK